MSPLRRRTLFAWLVLLLLAACDAGVEQNRLTADQKYLFLEALRQVEAGGRQLRSPGLSREALEAALATIDQGLKMGFQVKREFLDELDLRLGKNFERYFIRGVENYRIGIEAGDEDQQRRGLELLARWAEFWGAEQAAIMARLEAV